MRKRLDRIEVFRSDAWRWRKRAPNGRILCQGESHPTWGNAVRAAKRANKGCDYELIARCAAEKGWPQLLYGQMVDGAWRRYK